MKILVLYKKNSEHFSSLDQFIERLNTELKGSSVRIETLSADTRDGSALASIYDIFSFPAVLVLRNDGSVQKSWEGESFPIIDEVKAYALS